jgi:hypothetical protein
MPLPDLSNVLPREVRGGRTGGLFEYQYQQAAAEALELLADPTLAFVYCEWHDDYVVECSLGTYGFHQVKTRKKSLGPWTVLDIFGAKKPKGRSKKPPPANSPSIFSRMLENSASFGTRCARFSFVSDNGVESSLEKLLEAVQLVARHDDLADEEKKAFEQL